MGDWQLDYTGQGAGRERDRLAQLLAALQAFVGHDLPNQLVAAQGLARLLGELAGDRLDAEERGLVDRLAALAREADARARRLAEIGRLLRGPAWGPPVALREVVEEAVAAV